MALKTVPNGDQQLLACPSCGQETGLHIDATIMQAFAREDEPAAVLVTTSNGTTKVLPPGSAVPLESWRRHGVGLVGWCEHCGEGRFVLWFQQHKGATYVSHFDVEPESALAKATS